MSNPVPITGPIFNNMLSTEIQILERVVRVEEKIDNFLIRVMDQNDKLNDHESRLRTLEAGNSRLLGVGALGALLIGAAGSHLADLII